MNNQEEIKYFICTLNDNVLQLDPLLIEALEVKAGDLIEIGYVERQGVLKPFICKSENGKKLTKKNTIRISGKANTMLSAYGTTFKVYPNDKGIFPMYGSNPKMKVFTNVNTALNSLSKFSKEVILDKNYIIENFGNNGFQF